MSLRRSSTLGCTAPKRRSKLCEICHNLDPRGHTSSVYRTEASKTVLSSLALVIDGLILKKSACRFCSVLVQTLDAFMKDWRTSRSRICIEIVEKGSIQVSLNGDAYKDTVLEIYAPPDVRPPWPTIGSVRSVPSDSGSDESFKFARRCIEDCLTNTKHDTCRTESRGLGHPKRLVDVGRTNLPIKLIEPRRDDARYVTLSHCWGSGSVLSATTENYRTLKSFIPWESLPVLFQDAVIITRQLGMRYVWIDSLCILQDSKQDWESESAKMGDIYQNSYVTIAATTCADSGFHCLTSRLKPIKLQYTNVQGKITSLRARKVIDHHPDAVLNKPASPTGPLTTRSWALQEHVLCSRVLHYTATEIIFECKTAYRCECMASPTRSPTTPALIPKAIDTKGKQNVWFAWQHIVSQYSKRKLTVASDKLPAISGIASKIQSSTGSGYLAGIWSDNLAADLLWSSDPSLADPHTANRLTEWRAPSFSWVSVDTEIQYYTPDSEEKFKSNLTILEALCTPAGINPLGGVADGFISLRVPILEATLVSPDPGSFHYHLLVKGSTAIQVCPDTLLVEDTVDSASGPVTTVRRARREETYQPFMTKILCLNVASCSDEWISGLLLGQSFTTPGAYERLGTFASGPEVFHGAEKRIVKLV